MARRSTVLWLIACALECGAGLVCAQDPPPSIPHVVLDLRGTVPRFTQELQLAQSRGLQQSELPGRGLGAEVGLHLYLFKWKAVTFGLGGQLTLSQAATSPVGTPGSTAIRGVTERFTAVSPQLSLNFGDGDGWSYVSGGLGPSQRTLVPDGSGITEVDEQRIRSVNYGGGGRWFFKPHVAFTFDVRFHDIDPGAGFFGLPGPPRSRMLIIGAGLSIK